MLRIITGIILGLLSQSSLAQATIDWAELAKQDLMAMHDYLRQDSPGSVDSDNTEFNLWLEKGLHQALKKTQTITTPAGYLYTLRFYQNGFHDKHIALESRSVGTLLTAKWPGFTVRYQNQRFKIYTSQDPQEYPQGTEILSCDNLSLIQLMQRNVFPFFGNSHLPGDWLSRAPLLFTDYGNPWILKPKRCQFSYQGRHWSRSLTWQPLDLAKEQTLVKAYDYQPVLGVKPFAKTGLWINLATFAPENKQVNMLKHIVAEAASYRNYQPLVIDVRGNGGGSSSWGSELLENLYGEDFYSWATRSTHNTYEEFRVSKRNADYIRSHFLPMIAAHYPKQHWQYQTMLKLLECMSTTQQPFCKLADPMPANIPNKQPINPLTQKIYLLTDGRCSSSCQTFVAEALHFPNVIQVGQTTDANSCYGEIQAVGLQSGAVFIFPMAANRNRTFCPNKPFFPVHEYRQDINSTQALEAWIVSLN